MITCKNCRTEASDNDTICKVCNYPIQGTEKEKAAFIAKQIIQKSDVEVSIGRLKKARTILFILCGFYLLVPFTPLVEAPDLATIIAFIILGFIFLVFGLLTFRWPKVALLIPLLIIVVYYIALLIIDPALFLTGLIWKVIILTGLSYGYFSVHKADKILKENSYLASQMGFNQGKKK